MVNKSKIKKENGLEEMMMKNNKKRGFTFSSFIGNNRVLMILSVIIAFAIWLWVAIEKSPEVQVVISGVPVKINLEN